MNEHDDTPWILGWVAYCQTKPIYGRIIAEDGDFLEWPSLPRAVFSCVVWSWASWTLMDSGHWQPGWPPCCGFDQDLPRKFVVKCRSSQFSCSLGVVLESTGMSSPQTCPRKLCWWMAGSFVSCLQFGRRRVIVPCLSLYIYIRIYISL